MFEKYTGKHYCRSLFFDKVAGFSYYSGVFLIRNFPRSDGILRFPLSISAFSPNAGKCGPEKLRIRTLLRSGILTKEDFFRWFSWRLQFSWNSNFPKNLRRVHLVETCLEVLENENIQSKDVKKNK